MPFQPYSCKQCTESVLLACFQHMCAIHDGNTWTWALFTMKVCIQSVQMFGGNSTARPKHTLSLTTKVTLAKA